MAVIKTGGKQYLVKENSEIVVDRINAKEKEKINLETLALFEPEGDVLKIGAPTVDRAVEAEIVAHLKGDKIRVAKFKAKVRYRRVKGFRPQLTRIKIIKI